MNRNQSYDEDHRERRRLIMQLVKVLLGLLLGIFLLGIGVGIIAWGFFEFTDTRSEWPTVQGTITSSRAELDTSNDVPISTMFTFKQWLVSVSFKYEVNGVRYSWFQQWYESKAEAGKAQLKYSPGSIVTVYYHPETPTFAAVEPTKHLLTWADLIFYMLFIIPLIGGGVIVIILALQGLSNQHNCRIHY